MPDAKKSWKTGQMEEVHWHLYQRKGKSKGREREKITVLTLTHSKMSVCFSTYTYVHRIHDQFIKMGFNSKYDYILTQYPRSPYGITSSFTSFSSTLPKITTFLR